MSAEFGKIHPGVTDPSTNFSERRETQGNQIIPRTEIDSSVHGNEDPPIPLYEQYRSVPKSELPPSIHFGAWRPWRKGTEKAYPQHTELIKGQIYIPVRLYGPGK